MRHTADRYCGNANSQMSFSKPNYLSICFTWWAEKYVQKIHRKKKIKLKAVNILNLLISFPWLVRKMKCFNSPNSLKRYSDLKNIWVKWFLKAKWTALAWVKEYRNILDNFQHLILSPFLTCKGPVLQLWASLEEKLQISQN